MSKVRKNPMFPRQFCVPSGREPVKRLREFRLPRPPPDPAMPSFELRPFPPPALADVPIEYIIAQLHQLAPMYWDKPETADCTIIVPVPHPRGRSMQPPDTMSFQPVNKAAQGTRSSSGSGRRATEPILQLSPRLSLKLHRDYLSAKSTFLRGLFSGASPLDLINTSYACPPAFNIHSQTQSGHFDVPADRLPRLLPSPPDHPVLFLPVPDPTSFHLLIHWVYFGDTTHIEEALLQGFIQWEGLARNVEYLGLPTDIKVFLGRWYGNWLHPGRVRPDYSPYGSAVSDEDDSDYYDDSSITSSHTDEGRSDVEDNGSTVKNKADDDPEPQRGRTRTTRILAHLSPSSRPRSA